MNYLVTGAAGFIGAAVAEQLLQAGHEVVGIDNFLPYYSPALKEARWARLAAFPNFKGIRADLSVAAHFVQFNALPKIDRVLHLAAQAGVRYAREHPALYIDSNVKATTLLFDYIGHNWPQAKVVYASSSSVYGRNAKLPFSETDLVDQPASLYAATKRACELIADTYHHLFKLDMTGLRFFTVYGPWGRPDMAMWLFTKAIIDGEPLTLFNEGKLRRDFTYIDDIVAGVLAACDRNESVPGHRLYNLGNSQPVTVSELIASIERAVGKKAIIQHAIAGADEVEATYADITLAGAELDFAPRTGLTEGTDKFVAWYRGYRAMMDAQ